MRRRFPEKRICAEVATVEEAEILVRAGLDAVQCERFPEAELRRAVISLKAANPSVVVLAAGGVNADNAEALAATGVDGLVTSWPYFGKPFDVKMTFEAD
jgi:molybdenum transport protein